MDFAIVDVVNPPGASVGLPPYEASEPARYAMGDTLRFAQRMQLLTMEPLGDLSSTGYALANPGEEYIVLQPGEAGNEFSLMLDTGTYTVEWFSVNTRETQVADNITIERGENIHFTPPFDVPGPAVLYLKQVGR